MRTAATFAALFLAAGAGLLALNYALLDHTLHGSNAPQAVPSYPASVVITRAQAVLRNPAAPALDRAAAQADLALALQHPHRLLSGALLPVIGRSGVSGLQAARDHAFGQALSALLRQSVLILVPLALLAVVLGWLVAQRVLRPIRRLTATARQMSATNLYRRLHLTGPNDELKELGDTFDQMLFRLEEAFESQRRFIANASHELRTPLTIMRTELEVTLDNGRPGVAELRDMGEVVRAAVSRSERLVDGLLALAESERGLARTEDVDLAVLARSAVARADGKLTVTQELAPAPVVGTRVLLDRLLENLADNAVRHNHSGGWLSVRTAVQDGTAKLTMENSGPVITADEAASLFEPFRRLDHASATRGSGLGLSIVRAVARAHGGDATAMPLPAGGLRVTVALPADRAPC